MKIFLTFAILITSLSAFSLRLHPEDTGSWFDNSGNVTQGLTSYKETYFITQDAGRNAVLFNWIGENGQSKKIGKFLGILMELI